MKTIIKILFVSLFISAFPLLTAYADSNEKFITFTAKNLSPDKGRYVEFLVFQGSLAHKIYGTEKTFEQGTGFVSKRFPSDAYIVVAGDMINGGMGMECSGEGETASEIHMDLTKHEGASVTVSWKSPYQADCSWTYIN